MSIYLSSPTEPVNQTGENPRKVQSKFETKTHHFCVPSLTNTIQYSLNPNFKEVNQPGWWFQSLWKIWKSVGMIIPNIRKNKIHVPSHQPETIYKSPNFHSYVSLPCRVRSLWGFYHAHCMARPGYTYYVASFHITSPQITLQYIDTER